MKAALAAVGGAQRRKSGYMGRKRWAQPTIALAIRPENPVPNAMDSCYDSTPQARI
jgi:hypothetical protein